MANETKPEATGVQELIDQLHQTGVEEGRARGEELLREARGKADQILKEARQEADEILEKAGREGERIRESGQEAVRLAVRDAVLTLKAQLAEQFRKRVERLVSQTLSDHEFLRKLILELGRQTLPEDESEPAEVLLPAEVGDVERLAARSGQAEDEPLNRLTLSVAGEILREGVTLRVGDHEAAGIRIQLIDRDVEIDLTDKAIAALLLKHLLPRFRKMVEGQL